MDWHDQPTRKPEVRKESHELDVARVVSFAAWPFTPFKRMDRAARAPNVRIEADIVLFGVDRPQFGGAAGREDEILEILARSRMELGEEQPLETEPSHHPICGLDHGVRAVEAIHLFDEF